MGHETPHCREVLIATVVDEIENSQKKRGKKLHSVGLNVVKNSGITSLDNYSI